MANLARPSRPAVGVVTVSFGSGDTLPRLLESLDRAIVGGPDAVVVVDNRPTTAHDVEQVAQNARAVYLALPENPGYGAAANRGAAALPHEIEWVLIANPDLVLGVGSIDALLDTGLSDERIAAVGPATYSVDGLLYPSARPIPSLRQGIGHALLANIWIGNPWSSRYRAVLELDRSSDVGWLSGSCLLVRREAFRSVGGFDERYFMYFEDVDLGYRLGKNGYRNVFEPTASAVHAGGHSTGGSETRRMIEAHHESARRFLARKYSGPLLSPLRGLLALGLRIRSWFITRSLPR
jgi:N-acetylglucosaminyl-diphospho-decaprenol L-rhamnosyltransferase